MSLNKHHQVFDAHHKEFQLFLYETRKSTLPIDDILVWLVFLSLIFKESPQVFDRLRDIDLGDQKEFLITLFQKNEFIDKSDKSHLLLSLNQYISTDDLVKLIRYVNNISDCNKFADELIYAFQEVASKGEGESITDQVIVDIIKEILGDVSQLKIYDGAAGLCALTSQINAKNLVLEDINPRAVVIGKCILLLKNINNEYSLGNSLISHKKSVKADVVLTQAPWGVRLTPELIEKIKASKYIQMNEQIEIPTSASDSLWIQHSLYHLNENGRAILLMPQGWLFRGGYDAQLRDFLLESDLIEAVIGLPSGLLKITNIPTVLLIFNKNKVNKKVVHFIDASQMGANIKRNKELDRDEIRLIADLIKGKHQAHSYYRSVSLDEINEKHNELKISNYFNFPINLKVNDLKNERHKLELAQRKFNEAQEKLMNLIVENL
ncbi:hypothetical protein B1207_02895 [Legionella quinlivanii]|uniref:site-specific DNA-methyltransferase (adenine-specific) n=1 Tax=Legionella quinlivanii TaxID=45073 RepID=A0A364LM63_9GAMM|nr:N-6 DNA methylase [Legionella quinlivanii]RAP37952.1 hypothetical protein B1207_02895 [Legionella quinlivanii]